jgi:hypothetical protein
VKIVDTSHCSKKNLDSSFIESCYDDFIIKFRECAFPNNIVDFDVPDLSFLCQFNGYETKRLAKYTRAVYKVRVYSSYYSESELRGGAVTVSFSRYLPW